MTLQTKYNRSAVTMLSVCLSVYPSLYVCCLFVVCLSCPSKCNGQLHDLATDLFHLFTVFPLISRRRFAQMDVLEGLNVLVTISGKHNKMRVYYLSWLRHKIIRGDEVKEKRGYVTVGDLVGCIHYKIGILCD